MKSFQEFLTESSLSRLWSKYRKFASGTITAFRGERTRAENLSNNAQLKAALLGAGYSVTAVAGVYIENYKTPNAREVSENSFIVFDQNNKGTLKRDLMILGEKYDQDSITYATAPEFDAAGNIVSLGKYYLIGTSKRSDSYPGYHKEILLGTPMFGQSGEFHSKINGRPFIFKESVNESEDHQYDDQSRYYNAAHRGVMAKLYRSLCESDDKSMKVLKSSKKPSEDKSNTIEVKLIQYAPATSQDTVEYWVTYNVYSKSGSKLLHKEWTFKQKSAAERKYQEWV